MSYGETDDPSADIQYYITYSRRRARVSPIEVAYFAHLERDQQTAQKFFDVASSVEHCVCQATLYEKILRDNGHAHVSVISPGVDLEKFALKVRVGVVGRTYHTGRKGEQLVARLTDIPEIDWHFTGEGWPGPARHIPEHQLADFYRDMDYILVPALYEGGPMCVVEALACGREVVASDVGWVSDFPHIAFENGNVEDLRRVLLELIERKRALRATVLDRTWDAWAEGHDRLFRDLLVRHGRSLPSITGVTREGRDESRSFGASFKPALILHGNEKMSLGGPSVRVPRTARELRALGVDAEVAWSGDASLADFDLIHAFNVWNPDTALALLHRGRTIDRPLVLSSIYLDLSERPYWDDELPGLLAGSVDRDALDRQLCNNARRLAARRASSARQPEPVPGYHAKIREMLALCDHVICLSQRERELLASLGADTKACTIVHNPVDADSFSGGDPDLFADTYGVRDYVLCVARLEPRKNQLMLVHALRNTGLPIVLVGHAPGTAYAEAVRRIGGDAVRIIDRLPHDSELLRSAYAGARVAVLPSWSEGAPLAALEAAASGASLVLSDRSSEPEYFGDFALYCDPADPESIRKAVLQAYHTPRGASRIAEQKALVRSNYNWARYTEATAEVYRKALEDFGSRRAARRATVEVLDAASRSLVRPEPTRIVFDLTTSVNHKGRWTGISRVEIALARELLGHKGTAIAFVAWHGKSRRFISVPSALVDTDSLNAWFASPLADRAGLDSARLRGADFIVAGSAWMQNSSYASAVSAFAHRHDLRLTPLIHDIIPTKFPFWFNEGYAPTFERNLRALLVAADRVIAISDATRRDLQAFYLEKEGRELQVDIFREGDEIAAPADDGVEYSPSDRLLSLSADRRGFVLCVGAIHTRKNHRLLYDCWVQLAALLGKKAPRLAIVGGVAWNGHDLARAFREDRRLADLVHVLDDVPDDGLQWLYRNCLFTVYPSLYEGWGLPVAESLKYGKICLASNASSIPEIAPDATDLLDPIDVCAWTNRIRMYATSPAARTAREREIAGRYQPRAWSEAAAEVIGILRTPAPGRTAKAVYRIGDVVSLSDPLTLSRFGTGDWHLPEAWGAWTAGHRAGVSMHLGAPPEGDLLLLADCQALGASSQPVGCTVEVNGSRVGQWSLEGTGGGLLSARIPRSLFEGTLDVSLVNTHVDAIANLKQGATDQRRIGIGIRRFALVDATTSFDPALYFGNGPSVSMLLRPGEVVDLWRDKGRAAALGEKMTSNAHWGAFSPGPLTRLRPRMLVASTQVKLKLAVRALATGDQPQIVTVLVDGLPVDRWIFRESDVSTRELVLTTEQLPPLIEFLGERPASPSELGLGPETERFCFGILAAELVDDTMPAQFDLVEFEVGAQVALTSDAFDTTSPIRLGRDWYQTEETGTWMRGRAGSFRLRLPATIAGELHLHLDTRRFPSGDPVPNTIELTLNGIAIGAIPTINDWGVASVPLPVSALKPGAVNELGLKVSASGSVYSARAQGDARDLGVMLRAVCLSSRAAPERRQATPVEQSGRPRFRLRGAVRMLSRLRPTNGQQTSVQTVHSGETTSVD
ncbi:MAG: glycosyltransferase [Lautropia sp.]